MDLSAQTVAAIVGGGVALVVGTLSAVVTVIAASRRAAVDEKIALARGQIDRDIATLQGSIEKELTEQKDRLDNKTIFAAERVAHELMMDATWNWRTFKIIKHHLGGFDDDELRKILVRAGAIRVLSSSGEEVWGLIDRNRTSIGVERLSSGGGGGNRVMAPDVV